MGVSMFDSNQVQAYDFGNQEKVRIRNFVAFSIQSKAKKAIANTVD